MGRRAIVSYLLAYLHIAELPYKPGPEDETDQQGGKGRQDRPEGYIPEDVQE